MPIDPAKRPSSTRRSWPSQALIFVVSARVDVEVTIDRGRQVARRNPIEPASAAGERALANGASSRHYARKQALWCVAVNVGRAK